MSNTAYSFDMLFSYAVPENMQNSLKCGCRVLVSFGRSNKRRTGVVMSLKIGDTSDLKPIIQQIDITPVISDELIKLAIYMREQTFCTYFEAIKAMIPPGMSITIKEHYRLVRDFINVSLLSKDASELFASLKAADSDNGIQAIIDYTKNNGDNALITELCNKGAMILDNVFKQAVGNASVRMVRLRDEYLNSPEKFKLTPKQKKVADFLLECTTASSKELAYMCGVTTAVVKRISLIGVAEEYDNEILREVDSGEVIKHSVDEIILSNEQQKAHDDVFLQLKKHEPFCFLLHGVTGSGKTSVFEKLISDTLTMGRQALLLIPEIGLTPQILKSFKSLFGDMVAVIHSGLSLGQRLDEYKRIKRGDANIVIGTRSAIFAPLNNIGIIIIDEEGERSYKSDSSPRYITSDIAKQRCAYHGAVLLLASATPSIESYYCAEKGIYKLLEMKKRYHNNSLPKVDIIDMNLERNDGNKAEFSRQMIDEININLKNNEQSILLLNRRGYHTIISCCDCYKPIYCPNCSVPLTFHKTNGMMMCHYCGHSSQPITVCPSCGSEHLKKLGFGTQKLEEELSVFFPNARILRMDADTTFSRYSYEKKFAAFSRGEYDIMIGTQMIGKGLDFPNVTLVGILSVDKALYTGDFRSYERTFSLITQVVGRGGRGDKQGRALLQTFMPEHYVMNLAAQQDYIGFYHEEIAIRRAMIFPPICDMCVFCFAGISDIGVKNAADAVIQLMKNHLQSLMPKTPVRVLGPVKCSYGRINGKFRYRIIMKCKNNKEMREFINGVLVSAQKLKEMSKITFYADINGDADV